MNQFALLRYNFRVLMLNNRWLIAFPLAVSQLTVFWFVLTRRFSLDLPAQSVELVTPLLAAFLSAHLLSAEYRSRIGALLASRPVNISRIVVLRLLVMLALVWFLAVLSLMAYTFWMQPFDILPMILACIPSTLFLAMLALTFATLFRHSLAGFGIAGLYWALDLVPGAPLHPYLSLRSLSSYYSVASNPGRQVFLDQWWVAKVILLAGALLLYFFHVRLVFGLGTSQTVRMRRQAAAAFSILLVFYIVSGAVLKVGYGFAHRGALQPNDVGWFRYQLASYGPIPIAPLFGPAFVRYLGEISNPWRLPEGEDADVVGDTPRHRRDLHEVVEKMPNSLWAPSAAEALARLEARKQAKPEDAVAYYHHIVERYPGSPYQDYALRQIARTYADAERPAQAGPAYEELLKRVPGSAYRSEALRYLVNMERQAGHSEAAARWAEQWTSAAPLQDRFEAWIDLVEIRQAAGDTAGARQAAQQTIQAVHDLRRAITSGVIALTPAQKNQRQVAADQAERAAQKLQ